MNTSIGISESNRHAVATELSKLLADEFVLYTKGQGSTRYNPADW